MNKLFIKIYNIIKEEFPKFEIKYKNESFLMKILGTILFFNNFKNYTTIIGNKIYYPSKKYVKENQYMATKILCHEFVHMIDSKKHPIRYTVGYLMPQLLGLFSVFSLLFFINLWFLLSLGFLLFLLPIPSPWRTKYELRGYGMSCKFDMWCGKKTDFELLENYVAQFTGSAYYFMCRDKRYIDKKIMQYVTTDECLKDENLAYRKICQAIKEK